MLEQSNYQEVALRRLLMDKSKKKENPIFSFFSRIIFTFDLICAKKKHTVITPGGTHTVRPQFTAEELELFTRAKDYRVYHAEG